MLVFVIFAALTSFVSAHQALQEPGHFTTNKPYELSYPLNANSGPVSRWFFRGLKPSSAKKTINLKAGGSVTLHLGADENDANQRNSAVGDDQGNLHSANGKRTGCGLAISYKSFGSIKPDDLIVFSELDNCVTPTSKHTFKIPANLPATPKGKVATCAWGWVPSADASADEMYMTGFKCTVDSKTPAGSKIANASKLRFVYWAVKGIQLPRSRPAWNNVYPNGAQKLVISGASKAKSTAKPAKATAESTSKPKTAQANAVAKKTSSKNKCRSRLRRSVPMDDLELASI